MTKRTVFLALFVLAACLMIAASCAANTWDAYADFNTTGMPSHDWSYGWTSGTAISTYGAFTLTTNWGGQWGYYANKQSVITPTLAPNIVKNDTAATVYNVLPNTLSLLSWYTSSSVYGRSVLQWTAPATASYMIVADFTKRNDAVTVELFRNGASFWVGTSSCSYRGYVTLGAGDVISFTTMAGSGGWKHTVANVVIRDDTGDMTNHTGRVVDAYGHGLPNVAVSITGTPYSVNTNASGNYTLAAMPGSYTLNYVKSGYVAATQGVTVAGSATTFATVTMTATGVWDAKADFTYLGNPNGQWSYGSTPSLDITNYTFNSFTTSGISGWNNLVQYWGNYCGESVVSNTYASDNLGSYTKGMVSGRPPLSGGKAILRWTAPVDGWYTYKITMQDGYNTANVDAAIVSLTGSGQTTLASSPNIVAGTPLYSAYAMNMKAGDKIDMLCGIGTGTDEGNNTSGSNQVNWSTKETTAITASIRSGAMVIGGFVEDSHGNRLSGAKVEVVGGTDSVLTGTDGTYALALSSTNTYNIKASKLGYDYVLDNGVVVDGSGIVTRNYYLPDGIVVSGTVNNADSPSQALPGVNVYSGDGNYAALTGTAGNFSFPVNHTNFNFYYYRPGFLPKWKAINASTGSSVDAGTTLARGWDIAADYSSVTFPSTVPDATWNYGYESGTDTTFTYMTYGATSGTDVVRCVANSAGTAATFTKNVGWAPLAATSGTYNAVYRESQKLIATAGSSTSPLYKAVARYSAQASGLYHVTAKWSAMNTAGSTAKVALRKNGAAGTYLYGDPASDVKQLNGFAGRAVNGFTDSTGTSPVLSAVADVELKAGDTLDSVLYGNGGWVQVDLSVAMATSQITGRVVSDLPGNPPAQNVAVQIASLGYTAYTDQQGYYSLCVPSGTDYQLATSHVAFDPASATISVGDNQVVNQNFTLHANGTWNLASEFSLTRNPSGQWTFGRIDQGNNNLFIPYDGYIAGYMDQADSREIQSCRWLITRLYNTTDTATWMGSMGKNVSATACGGNNWGANPNYWYIEPGQVFMISGNRNSLAAARWTAPDTRIIQISGRLSNQCSSGGSQALSIVRNGSRMVDKIVNGFAGTIAANYTDSSGTAPVLTYGALLMVNQGDTLDFCQDFDYNANTTTPIWSATYGCNAYQLKAVGVSAVITTVSATVCTSLSQLKSQPDGATIIMNTPLQLLNATNGIGAFDKLFGSPTTAEYACYVQSDDRVQGIKLIVDAGIPAYAAGTKITFSGTMATVGGQRVVKLISINSAVTSTGPQPMGRVSKMLVGNNTLVKVWGKIVSLTPNSLATPETWQSGTPPVTYNKWDYEYITINDGGQDVKIPMHMQTLYMSSYDAAISGLNVGDYIAVTGVLTTTDGTDVVVIPRGVGNGFFDIMNCTDLGL